MLCSVVLPFHRQIYRTTSYTFTHAQLSGSRLLMCSDDKYIRLLIFIYVCILISQQSSSFAPPQYTNNPFLDERSCVTEMDKEPIESFLNGESDLRQKPTQLMRDGCSIRWSLSGSKSHRIHGQAFCLEMLMWRERLWPKID